MNVFLFKRKKYFSFFFGYSMFLNDKLINQFVLNLVYILFYLLKLKNREEKKFYQKKRPINSFEKINQNDDFKFLNYNINSN